MEQTNSKVTFPEIIEQSVFYDSREKPMAADRYKAIIDADAGKVFSIVSQGYKPIRHEAAIEQIEAVIDKNQDLGRYGYRDRFL